MSTPEQLANKSSCKEDKGISNFHKSAKVALILIYMVIIAGAVVRMTGSGMGCPDWPKCFGYLIPPTDEEQLKWHPEQEYKKGQIIIHDEALYVAKDDFKTSSSYSKTNWKPYTKHDYAVFNAKHTWVEYINRLFGALSGLATLVMAILSIKFRKKNKIIPILSWLVVFGMGFQAWLGKTVVDSNLQPVKITIHMVMALVIVALVLYIIFAAKNTYPTYKPNKLFFNLLVVSLLLTLIQVVLGTQVRQFVDEQIKLLGDNTKQLWLQSPEVNFYIHRTLSVGVFLVNTWIFYLNRKLMLGYSKVNWVMLLIILEIISGILMYYIHFPFGTQTIHLVIASLLFGLQFYLILEGKSSLTSTKTL